MKKAYEAPEILFEDFSLSTSISAGCEKIINPLLYTCGVYYPGVGMIFIEGNTGCEEVVEDTHKTADGYCYHVPSEDKNLFNS